MRESYDGNSQLYKAAAILLGLLSLFLCVLLYTSKGSNSESQFQSIEKSASAQSEVLATINDKLLTGIVDDSNSENHSSTANSVQVVTEEFVTYIDRLKSGIRSQMEESPSDKVTSLIMGSGKIASDFIEQHGNALAEKVNQTNAAYQELAGNDPELISKLSLKIDEEAVLSSGKNSWASYYFNDQSDQSLLPLLTALQHDAYHSAFTILKQISNILNINKLGGQVEGLAPVFLPQNSVVTPGETFNASIYMSPILTPVNGEMKVWVNGSRLAVEDGVAHYQAMANSMGVKDNNVKIEWLNAQTGEITTFEKSYQYRVSANSIVVSADKMNVFYVGVDNPLSISAGGVSSNDLRVSIAGAGGMIKRVSSGTYNVVFEQPGECRLSVSTGNGLMHQQIFRVKSIPDPLARISRYSGGSMGVGEFKAQGGVGAFLDNFDFDAQCQVQGFRMTRISPGNPPEESINAGARYTEASSRIIQKTKPGDVYTFDQVKARCPGDPAGRLINSMVFKIK